MNFMNFNEFKKRPPEAQTRRHQIGSFPCGNAGAKMPGRAGSGRVATETGIRKWAPSKGALEKKYAVRANPSLRHRCFKKLHSL